MTSKVRQTNTATPSEIKKLALANLPTGISSAYVSEDLEEVVEAYEEFLVDCLLLTKRLVGSVLVQGLGEAVSEPSSKIGPFVGKLLDDQVPEGLYFIWEENPKGNPEHGFCDEAWQENSSSSE